MVDLSSFSFDQLRNFLLIKRSGLSKNKEIALVCAFLIMATISRIESKRMYSWWWDSHISPKNSRWLQENLTDMDKNIKAMIKLIEEDADSFARRAEMYYRKRPELIKLVEEFYRAYRALAERYDHATGALCHAQQTIAEAFPDQVSSIFPKESPSTSYDTELDDSQIRAICWNGPNVEDKKGLKQLHQMFPTEKEDVRDIEELKAKVKELEEEISRLTNINVEKTCAEEQCLVLEKENESLRKELEAQGEEVRKRVRDLEELKNSIQEENQKRMQTEVALVSMEKIHDHTQREAELLTQNFKDMESTKTDLDKEINELTDIIIGLKEHNISFEEENRVLKRGKSDIEEMNQALHEQNEILVSSLSDANMEVEALKEKVQALEASCETLIREVTNHASEKSESVYELSEKCAFLENSLSDVKAELMDSRRNVMDLEESLNFSNHQNSCLLAEKNTSILQVENLERKLSELESELSNLHKEKDAMFLRTMELESSLELQKQSHDALLLSSSRELDSLKSKTFLLEDQLKVSEEIFVKSDIENYILKRYVHDSRDAYLGLSADCQRHIEASTSLTRHYNELRDGILVFLKELDINIDGTHDKVVVQKILDALTNSLQSISEDRDEIRRLQLQKAVFITLLKEFGLEKSHLYHELQSRTKESSLFQIRKDEFEAFNKELMGENNILHLQVQSIQEKLIQMEIEHTDLKCQQASIEKAKNSTLNEITELMNCLKEEREKHEASTLLESQVHLLLEEARAKDEAFNIEQEKHICTTIEVLVLKSCLCDISTEYQKILEESSCSYVQKKELTLILDYNAKLQEGILILLKEINNRGWNIEGAVDEDLLQIITDETKDLLNSFSETQHGNRCVHLEILGLISLIKENRLQSLHDARQLSQFKSSSLVEKTRYLSKRFDNMRKKMGELEDENIELLSEVMILDLLCIYFRSLSSEKVSELESMNDNMSRLKDSVVVREFDLNLTRHFCKECELHIKTGEHLLNRKDVELTEALEKNADLCKNLDGLEKRISTLLEFDHSKDKEIMSLHKENELLRKERDALNCRLLNEEKAIELVEVCENNLESCDVAQKKLKRKSEDLEEENRVLRDNINASLLLLVSLSSGIYSLEERVFSLSRQQRQIETTSRTLSDEDSGPTFIRLSELKILVTKVERLRDVISETEKLLLQEQLDFNAALETKKKETEQLQQQLSHARQNSKEKFGKTKDIQLDQVATSRAGSYRLNNTELDDQHLELWETYEIDEEIVKSEHPSSELVPERDQSVDKLEVNESHAWNRNIMNTLCSDAQKLSVLDKTLRELKSKWSTLEKKKKVKTEEHAELDKQFIDFEAAVSEQLNINVTLKRKVEYNLEYSGLEQRQVLESTRKGSEAIEKLEMELQKLEYIVLKLQDASRKKASVLLRGCIYVSAKKKQRRFCGCVRPKTKD